MVGKVSSEIGGKVSPEYSRIWLIKEKLSKNHYQDCSIPIAKTLGKFNENQFEKLIV